MARAAVIQALIWALCSAVGRSQLLVGFYDSTCPRAESIVQQNVVAAVQSNPIIAARLLRLFFHDCFVEGCDGSILLESTGTNKTEKDSLGNLTVGGYEVIDAIKNTVEAVCPGTVSCADLVALAARDAVSSSGGPHWDVPTGRRDGVISQASSVPSNLPDPSFSVDQLTVAFAAKGLSQADLAVLSGAHTIGVAHCGAIMDRFNTVNGSVNADATLDPTFAKSLEAICPNSAAGSSIPLDGLTNAQFDSAYYTNLKAGRGLMSSDQALFTDPRTRSLVNVFATDQNSFFANFQLAMVKMGSIGVKTGSDGQIRRSCRFVNS